MEQNQIRGLGINYLPNFKSETPILLKHFNFMEVIVEGAGPYVEELKQLIPITFHGMGLSFASNETSLDTEYLTSVKTALETHKPSWYSDHFAFTRTSKCNVPLFVAPIPSSKGLDKLIARSFELAEFLGQPVHLENVADFVVSPQTSQKYRDFIQVFFRESASRLILNINSLIITADRIQMPALKLLQRFPLDRIQSATLVLPFSQNVLLTQLFGALVEREMMDVIDFLFSSSSLTNLLVQRESSTDTWDRIAPQIESIQRRIS